MGALDAQTEDAATEDTEKAGVEAEDDSVDMADERPADEPPLVAPSPTVAIHVHGDGHRAESDEGPPPADTASSAQTADNVDNGPQDDVGFFAWPDDDVTDVLPPSAFQVISQDELPPGAWPHPSTWVVPGTDWNELHEPSETEEV